MSFSEQVELDAARLEAFDDLERVEGWAKQAVELRRDHDIAALHNQIEGCIVQTVSRTLKEEVTFDRSMVTSLDWSSYPILTFSEVPDVLIDLIDRPEQVPWGGGEPTCAVVPSAIAGAVFEATGVRLRSTPFTPAKVRNLANSWPPTGRSSTGTEPLAAL